MKSLDEWTSCYDCPVCEEQIEISNSCEVLYCPKCSTPLKVCRDAETENGEWKDRTTLVEVEVKP